MAIGNCIQIKILFVNNCPVGADLRKVRVLSGPEYDYQVVTEITPKIIINERCNSLTSPLTCFQVINHNLQRKYYWIHNHVFDDTFQMFVSIHCLSNWGTKFVIPI